jgi:hypothetical protein
MKLELTIVDGEKESKQVFDVNNLVAIEGALVLLLPAGKVYTLGMAA